jgi:hypothetical protein
MQLSRIVIGLEKHASIREFQVDSMSLSGSQAALEVTDLVEATGIIP